MTKKQISIIWLVLLVAFAGCNDTLDVNEDISGFYGLYPSVVFPAGAESNYVFLFNGDTVRYTGISVNRRTPTGKLVMVEKGKTDALYTEELTLTNNTTVQIIKLGDKFDRYTPEKYTQFSLDIKWATAEEQFKYKALYNGVELTTSLPHKNYVPMENVSGELQLVKLDDNSVVLSRKMTVEPDATITLLQVSDVEFLEFDSNDEQASSSDDYTKVRVYYTLTDELKEKSYTITFYAFDVWTYDMTQVHEIASIEIEAGKISPYVEVSGRIFEESSGGQVQLTYDLVSKDGTIVRTHTTGNIILFLFEKDYDNYLNFRHKFSTFNISNISNSMPVLVEEW